MPASNLILTFPLTVSISLDTPKTASEILTYKSKCRLLPSLLKFSSSNSLIKTSKSPEIPSDIASFPFPLTLSCIPSSTPAGILTSTVSSVKIWPFTSEPGAFLVTILPVPEHALHVVVDCIRPKIVFVICVTCPDPPHWGQVENSVPGAWTFLLTFIFLLTPLAISFIVKETFILRFVPFDLLCEDPPKPPKPPNAPPNISPNWLNMSSIFIPPAPNPPDPSKAAWPNWSYLALFSEFPKTS